MPLQPRCHTIRPDRASGWFSFFELTRRGDRTAHLLAVGPADRHSPESREAALMAGQAVVRYFKDTPASAPSKTLIEGASTLLLHEASSSGTELEFGCGVIDGEHVWIVTRGRVRLVPIAPRIGSPKAAESLEPFAIGSQVRYFFGRFPEELEDPRYRNELATRLEQTGGGDGGLVLSFMEVEALRGMAPALKATRPITPISETTIEAPSLHPAEPETIPEPEEESARAGDTVEIEFSPKAPDPEDTAEVEIVTAEEPEKEAVQEVRSEAGLKPQVTISFGDVLDTLTEVASEDLPEEEEEEETAISPANGTTEPAPPPTSTEPVLPTAVNETLPLPGPLDASSSPPVIVEPIRVEEPVPTEEPVGRAERGVHDTPPRGETVASAVLSPAYAPEETRGVGFWAGIVALVAVVGLLIGYLYAWRSDSGGDDPSPVAADAGNSAGADASTVQLLWEQRFDKAVTSSPCRSGDAVVFGCRDGTVYALGRSDGQRLWAYATSDGFGSSPVPADGKIIIGGYDGRVYALDAETGNEVWTVATGGRIVASPVADETSIYIGSYDHKLYSIALEDGAVHWSADLGAVLWSSPVLIGDRVIVGSLDGKLSALSSSTGRVLWEAETQDAIHSSPVTGDGKVFVGSKDRHIYAFSVESGEPLWRIEVPAAVNGSPAYHEGRVVIGSEDGTVFGIDAGLGTITWTLASDGAIKSRPAFDESRVWITGYDGFLRGIDWRSGQETSRFPIGTSAFSSPLLADGCAYFGGMDGRFIAVQLPRPPTG